MAQRYEKKQLGKITMTELFIHLLRHGEDCRLDLFSVKKFIGRSTTEKEALAFIRSYSKEFEVKKVDGKQIVEAKTSVTLCDAFQERKCEIPSCKQLHICRFFLQGGCKFGEKCQKPHSFDSPETKELLRRHKIDDLRPSELRNLFKKVLNEKRIKHTSESSGPELCKFYNKGICKNGDQCDFLHVCEHYVEGDCKFGRKCNRFHDFYTIHSKRILADHSLGGRRRDESKILSFLRCSSKRVSSSLEPDFSSSSCQFSPKSAGPSGPPAARHASGSSTPESDHEKLEICGFNLRGKCQYGAKCNARHTILPYEWQYVLGTGSAVVWTSFTSEENGKIEKEFCDFNVDHARATLNEGFICPIDFQTMTGKLIDTSIEIKIRRLSTVSSVLAASGHVFRTKWKWYWLDEHKNWQSYDDGKTKTTSEKIEQDFLQSESEKKKHNFSTDSNKYNLFIDNPNQLYQQNDKSGTKRNVQRRPAQFLDEGKMKTILEEFKKKCQTTSIKFNKRIQNVELCEDNERFKNKRQRTSSSSSITNESQYSVPAHWSPIDPSKEFKVVDLSEDIHKEEFTKVKTQFLATMAAGFQIKSIKRVQNVGLWEDYERQKSKIEKKNSGNPPEERWLFHGTNNDTVDPICQQGFDWRLNGKHGTVYGKGSYFACEASYSHSYSKSSDPRMFMAKVIVGSYVLGSHDMQRPPPKDKSNHLSILHDSCVNDVSKPTIFVVFERSQAYPCYIINYNN